MPEQILTREISGYRGVPVVAVQDPQKGALRARWALRENMNANQWLPAISAAILAQTGSAAFAQDRSERNGRNLTNTTKKSRTIGITSIRPTRRQRCSSGPNCLPSSNT